MFDIHSLPVEILDLIFRQLRRISSHDAPSIPVQAHFPFNIAHSCCRWSTILLSSPPCLKVVTVDLADDPMPILKVFDMFAKDCGKEFLMAISVYSSVKPTAPDASVVENTRARAIFSHLETYGVLFYCSIILFDLVFQSSLPCAARILTRNLPFLSELRLSCTIYDVEQQQDGYITLGRSDVSEIPNFQFPSLEKVSVPGWSFMQLCLVGSNWLGRLECSTKHDIQAHLTVTHFAFEAPFWLHSEDRCLSDFLEALELLRAFKRVTLSDLSLRYQPSKRYTRTYDLKVQQLTLDSVSPHFMYAFFGCTHSVRRSLRALTLRNCNIPELGSRVDRHYNAGNLILQLVDIRQSDNLQPFNEDSIYNAIGAFPAAHVFLQRCSNMTYRFFHWLCQDMDYGLELPDLRSLTIHDCNEFDSVDLRFLIEAYEPDDFDNCLDRVEISGNVPLLSTADAQWFLERQSSGSGSPRIIWNSQACEKVQDKSKISQLWPDDDRRIWDEDEGALISAVEY